MNKLADIISLAVIPFMISPFVIYGITNNINILVWGIIVLLNVQVSSFLKWSVFDIPGFIWRRPEKASRCGLYNNESHAYPGLPGFPSGHLSSTSCFFFVGYLATSNLSFIYGGILACFLMGWARLQKHCHNIYQVLGGILAGIIIGGILWMLFLTIKKYTILNK